MSVAEESSVLKVSLAGTIDAEFDFPLIGPKVREVNLEVGKIKSINSMGVRNWILWRKSAGADLLFRLFHCPEVLVNQINILGGFLPLNSVIESFYVPLRCDGCNFEQRSLMVLGEDYQYSDGIQPSRVRVPEANCPNCRKPLELDVISNKYFSFLTR